MTYLRIYKQLTLLIFTFLLVGCNQENNLTRIEGKRLEINDSLASVKSIDSFIAPYRLKVNENLDEVISYATDTYSKRDGELNTAIGNFMADLVFEEANPIFKSRTGKEIDMVLLNHGGIRAIISKGPITQRTAFEVMPFENSIVIVELKGTHVNELVSYLEAAKRAHPIAGLKLTLGPDDKMVEATINGQPIDTSKTYNVATNDYLYYGGDRMTFLAKTDTLHILDYKIRNAMIDHFKKNDTINPVIDDRFIKIN